MALKLKSIGGKGIYSEERIGFVATARTDTKYFLVFSTRGTENGFYNRSDRTFWFPPQPINPFDKVVLYTKPGVTSVKKNDDGTKTYFFYWGLGGPIFTDDGKIVALATLNTWELSTSL